MATSNLLSFFKAIFKVQLTQKLTGSVFMSVARPTKH